jgi:hypothetical protein
LNYELHPRKITSESQATYIGPQPVSLTPSAMQRKKSLCSKKLAEFDLGQSS